jgi:TM2 domain-containing membrane protein YozV
MKNKTTAGILAIFLGGLGIHKFYLGKWIQGFIYLIFCFTYIPAIIAIFEGISYFIQSDEEFNKKYTKISYNE